MQTFCLILCTSPFRSLCQVYLLLLCDIRANCIIISIKIFCLSVENMLHHDFLLNHAVHVNYCLDLPWSVVVCLSCSAFIR